MILDKEQIQTLKEIIKSCLLILYQNDNELIRRKGLEQSIAFRFAVYLNEAITKVDWLNGLQLDAEYNKNGVSPKRTPRRPKGVRPDLIIHSRGNNNENILVIEIKGWWNSEPREIDFIKLEDFTHQEGEYKYGLGVFLELLPENCIPEYYVGY
ncbi:hypothetical protein IC229_22425 [Spirosoma sp. BT702]|uniref:Uncharacterized protein n=1 Tax=Spirosoma profusum TaxID=2771354 RepID=A0A926XZ08_9BACT|nr:hypothetical protein [Spirosoma profusum]MBD2703417.1 hypothetical protein [Spirosoma profusum]